MSTRGYVRSGYNGSHNRVYNNHTQDQYYAGEGHVEVAQEYGYTQPTQPVLLPVQTSAVQKQGPPKLYVRADNCDAFLDFRIILPNDKFPSTNFAGRIIGHKGATIKELSQKHQCRLYLNTEDNNRPGDGFDPAVDPPHVRIQMKGPLPSTLRRMADVSEEISKRFAEDWKDPTYDSQKKEQYGDEVEQETEEVKTTELPETSQDGQDLMNDTEDTEELVEEIVEEEIEEIEEEEEEAPELDQTAEESEHTMTEEQDEGNHSKHQTYHQPYENQNGYQGYQKPYKNYSTEYRPRGPSRGAPRGRARGRGRGYQHHQYQSHQQTYHQPPVHYESYQQRPVSTAVGYGNSGGHSVYEQTYQGTRPRGRGRGRGNYAAGGAMRYQQSFGGHGRPY